MKKIFFLLIGLVLLSGCTQSQVANPASVYCEQQGGTVDIRNFSEGQVGYCVFEDLTECEEWAFYNGECSKETASSCKDLCGDGNCDEVVCQSIGCACAENAQNCPSDCS